MKMNKASNAALLAFLLVALAACAAGSDASHQAVHNGAISQIALGFWHGLIAPITLIGEIIQKVSPKTLAWSFRFYEPDGTGVLYDIGFFVGLVAGPSALWTGSRRRR
jgi:hypothetical protein